MTKHRGDDKIEGHKIECTKEKDPWKNLKDKIHWENFKERLC